MSVLKTVVTVFNKNRKKTPIRIFFGDDLVSYETNPKFLGIIFDQNLSFAKHTDTICIRARRRLNMLSSMKGKKWGLSSELMIASYKVLIRSIFDYSSLILITIAPTTLNKFAILQNKAIRISTYWPPGTTTTEMLNKTNLEPLKIRSFCLIVNYLNKSLIHNTAIGSLLEE